MKQARSWKINNKGSSEFNFVASANSLEEEAFAEDAAGSFIWPPRSYYCSFCGREFRSAQALGGHMNVHRRDRARLNQSPSPQNENHHNHHHYYQIQPHEQKIVEEPVQICDLINSPNYTSSSRVVASQVSPTDFLSPFAQESSCEDYSLAFPTIQMRIHDDSDTVKSNRSLNLDFDVELEKGKGFGSKRKRTDKEPQLSLFVKPSTIIKCNLQSQIKAGLSASTIEDVDLELRLGHRPKKVK